MVKTPKRTQKHSIHAKHSRFYAVEVVLVLLSASLSAVGFLWARGATLSFIGLTLTVYLLLSSEYLKTRSFVRLCYLYGLVFFGLVMMWMWHVTVADLIINTTVAFIFKTLTTALVIAVLAVGFVLLGGVFRQIRRLYPRLPVIILLPMLWIVSEYLRSLLFSIFWIGPGGSIGPYWNFGTTGLLAVGTPLRYASRLVGLYGLSFLLVMLAVATVMVCQKRIRYVLLALVPLILSLSGWYLYSGKADGRVTVSAVALKAGVDYGYEQRLNSLLRGKTADTMILPEYSYYYYSKNASEKPPLPIYAGLYIDSKADTDTADLPFNALQYRSSDGQLLEIQHKSLLVPGGEYVPYLYGMILFYSGNRDIVHYFNSHRAVSKSPSRELPFTYNGVSYGTLVCSGVLAPTSYRQLTKSGAQILVNSASTSTLGVSGSYYLQADQITGFMAVANDRWFEQSSRGGQSYIKNQNGVIEVASQNQNDIEVITDSVPLRSQRTLYTVCGEWVLWASIIGVAVLLAFTLLRRLQNR